VLVLERRPQRLGCSEAGDLGPRSLGRGRDEQSGSPNVAREHLSGFVLSPASTRRPRRSTVPSGGRRARSRRGHLDVCPDGHRSGGPHARERPHPDGGPARADPSGRSPLLSQHQQHSNGFRRVRRSGGTRRARHHRIVRRHGPNVRPGVDASERERQLDHPLHRLPARRRLDADDSDHRASNGRQARCGSLRPFAPCPSRENRRAERRASTCRRASGPWSMVLFAPPSARLRGTVDHLRCDLRRGTHRDPSHDPHRDRPLDRNVSLRGHGRLLHRGRHAEERVAGRAVVDGVGERVRAASGRPKEGKSTGSSPSASFIQRSFVTESLGRARTGHEESLGPTCCMWTLRSISENR
jgi:hypothetical protein